MVNTVRDAAKDVCCSHPAALLPRFLHCGISSFASQSLEWFAFVEFNFTIYGPSKIIAMVLNKNQSWSECYLLHMSVSSRQSKEQK
jgi:hypothetical protein